MATITCIRCNQNRDQLARPPLPGDLGNRIYDTICHVCWKEWLGQQTAVINHYGLDLLDPKARQFLTQQTEAFLFSPLPKAPEG
jgi:Fe-S cluster biosynthesis and repair protein YggX